MTVSAPSVSAEGAAALQVSARVSAAGQTLATATSAGVAKTREFNEKHQITDRVRDGKDGIRFCATASGQS